MENSKKSGIAKLKKLGLTDEEINAMLGIEEIPPEEELARAEEQSELQTKAWKQDFLIEQLKNYNLDHKTNYKLEEWVVGIQDETIAVHFDWKELAGIRPYPLNDATSPEFKAAAAKEKIRADILKKEYKEKKKEHEEKRKEFDEWKALQEKKEA